MSLLAFLFSFLMDSISGNDFNNLVIFKYSFTSLSYFWFILYKNWLNYWKLHKDKDLIALLSKDIYFAVYNQMNFITISVKNQIKNW